MKEQGIVYVLTNPCMPGIVKIGMTERSEMDARLKELYTTGVPLPFECKFACRVNKSECGRIEKALHTAFAPQRVNANREFFRVQPEQAIAILELFHHEVVTDEVTAEIENDLTAEDRAAVAKSINRRPPLDFIDMGLQVGDVLTWKEDPSIVVRIASAHKVIYKDEEYSLSGLSAQLKGSHAKYIAPCPWWLYEDKLLSEVYDETYPMLDNE